MALPSLQLPHGVRLIRADAIEAPVEAMRSEGMGRASWEPQFLAVAEQGEGPDSAADGPAPASRADQRHEALQGRRHRPRPLRLRPGRRGPLEPDPDRRAGHPARRLPARARRRPSELAELAVALEARPDPDGALSWAVARFEMGCARESALEGLSDHLLALRAVLEGHGPVGASLPMRASALIAADESCDRIEARGRVESALELERALMTGAATHGGIELAAWVEEGDARLLRQAALGELGTDLNTAADETLIATGLDGGDMDIDRGHAFDAHRQTPGSEAREVGRIMARALPTTPICHRRITWTTTTRIMEPVPAEDEIRITATNWLDEVSVEEGTMEWTAAEGDGSDTASGSTPRASATSSRCPRTPTGRSASSSTTTTAAAPASPEPGGERRRAPRCSRTGSG